MALSRELMRRPRVVMELAARGAAGVLSLGRYNHTAAHPGLTEHAHVGAIEICFLVKGRQTYRLGERDYRLTGGDVFIAFPDERHSTGGNPQEKGELYWMTVVASPSGSLLGLPARQGKAVLRSLLNLGQHHFRGSWRMKDSLDAITTLYHLGRSPLADFAISNHAGAFLLEVLACAESGAGRAVPRPLVPVLRHIEQHLDEPLPISQLASLAGLSEARFKARFKAETGIPPGEYVLRARIQEAERRLAEDEGSITRIAFDLGFSTSQYFATVFKRFTGQTPSALKRGLAASPPQRGKARRHSSQRTQG